MQKPSRLLLATLALLGTSAVFAQSSVTLYGRVNTSVERQKVGGTSNTVMQNNSSRFGFKGTEDLGGGLKAGFQLESGFNSDTGTGSGWTHPTTGMTFARQSEVNLSGGFGMIRLGNFTPESYYATADYVSMHNHDTGTSSDALYYDPVWFGGLSTTNKIGYRSPSLGGLTIDASVNLHEQTTGGKNGYDLAANYNIGALNLGAGYSQVDSNRQLGLRALYTFGQFVVGGYYQRNKDDNQLLATGAGNRNNFRLAGAYMMGASEFHVNVGRAGKWSDIADSSATQWTLGYNYNFSKRTKVYAFYTKVDNKAGATYMTGAAGQDFSSLALGVRHNF
ncbi:MAG: porin [Diaphorobacter nitroreducens]|uniref:Porin n=1 Tax=Diaphorobacter nitroreducens TaxID=164759 RepID=A0AAX1WPV4_9BURK|nr:MULTISPECIES: porin [Diaphorobacter]TFI48548.1 porin [Diaphorobacter sp. DS2]ASI70130.1 porin [Diaphorobacter nitroreducens]MBV2215695.1 porin [Diaphorobacter sp.]ROR39003.1 putative porin [Diaphorobacter nitroreducens]WKK88536.1 porin [Diaphorobacter sp. C33]